MRDCYLTAASPRFEQPIGSLAKERTLGAEHHVEPPSLRKSVTGQVALFGVTLKNRRLAITFSIWGHRKLAGRATLIGRYPAENTASSRGT